MREYYLEKIEYNKILEELKKYCYTYLGEKEVEKLKPENNNNKVENKLKETDEAITLLYRIGNIPITNIEDNTIAIQIMKTEGTLSAKMLLEVIKILKISETLKKYFDQGCIKTQEFTILSKIFEELYTNNGIVEKVSKSIIDEETIADEASQTLLSIRRKERKLTNLIKEKLNNMIHSSKFNKKIQESVITIRNNRYVIPVKEEYKQDIKGFIHDISSTGSTVFIEPIAILEMNNEINQLKIEENREIERILQELSQNLYPYINEIEKDIELIGKLDFIFAKANYARSIKANIPQISQKKEIILKNARHPLIEIEKAVPITLSLGKEFQILLITGPNTGGKTVTLKTVGLLNAMACSGLAIPAESTSTIYVFDNIFADIGDDQSISDSLSTFSSHMKNIVDILKNATENSLVLVDELGSGTDPIEGAELAISILQELKEKNILTIATTHYPELKKYALTTKGFENASVAFDIETLTPTYKLLVGIPGRSNAFEISKKLGLDEKILLNAKKRLNQNEIHFEEILKNIYDDKQEIEKEKEIITKQMEETKALKEKAEKEVYKIEEEKTKILQKAKIEARDILLDAKEEVNNTMKKMQEIKENKDLNNIRNKINEKIKDISLKSTNKETNEKNNEENKVKIEDIVPNKQVYVKTFNQNGIILSRPSKNNEVMVQIGSMKINVKINDLEIKKENKKNKSTINYSNISKSKTIHSEINIIGYTVEEARDEVEKFLDDCALAKLQTIRIVHGKGTGKLREGIHQILKRNAHVKSFRLGTFGEGEMGVTIVELK